MSRERSSKMLCIDELFLFLQYWISFFSEEKEEEEDDDGGLDDWEAMVSDEDEEKGERVNTKRMYFFLINSCSQGFVFCLYRKQ